MKILVTGYKGMIGSKIYNYLQNLNKYYVKGIDVFDNTGDICTFKTFESYDIVIHCAALASVTESIKHPIRYYNVNVLGTYNLLNQCPNSKFIFMSSSAIYGEGLNHKEDGQLNPISPYAENKIDGEFAIKKLAKDYTILRLANIYGGKKGERGVYQIFEEEKTLPIYGDGSAARDYFHVDNLCEVIYKSFNISGIFNIGSGKIKTVLDIAKEFNKPIQYLPARLGEIKIISLDITKAKQSGLL